MNKTKKHFNPFGIVSNFFNILISVVFYFILAFSFVGVLFVFAYFELYTFFYIGIFLWKLLIISLVPFLMFKGFEIITDNAIKKRKERYTQQRKLFKEEIKSEIKREINGRRK